MNRSQIIEESKKPKTVFLKNIENNVEIETAVYLTQTVGDLKRTIERLFGFNNGFLNGYNLKMKYKGQREGRLLDSDNTTLYDNHLRSYSIITFMKTKNQGGNGIIYIIIL